MPLIDNLEIRDIFKDKDKEEGDGVIDLILAVVQLLKRDINRLVVKVQNILKLVKLQNKGQSSYMASYIISSKYRIYKIY